MNQMKAKKSRSYDQHKLKIVCDQLCDRIYDLLDALEIEYTEGSKMLTMSCPIHGGDNPSALNIYPYGDSYRGNWKCRTHNCEKIFKASIIGFIRGVLSNREKGWSKDGDDACSFDNALDFALKFLNQDLKDIKVSRVQKDKMSFTNTISNLLPSNTVTSINKVNRKAIRSSLQIPSPYYIDRGYTKSILDRYDIGNCTKNNKEMSGRVVVPIYDNEYRHMVGCSGRSTFQQCSVCESYHDTQQDCPHKEDLWKYSKWKHNFGLKCQNHLYNYWFAKEHILRDGYAIIVESPGNVWRLEENGIRHSIAIFGTSLSNMQKIILDGSGAMTLIILMDNDDAGHKAAEIIKQKCYKTYKILMPSISSNDVGEMTTEQIQSEIYNFIRENI